MTKTADGRTLTWRRCPKCGEKFTKLPLHMRACDGTKHLAEGKGLAND